MDFLANTDLLTVGIAIAANLILGSVIFFHDSKSVTNLLFLLQTVILSAWSSVNYLSYQWADPVVSLWLVRLVLFFAVPNSIVFLFLMHTFPEKRLRMGTKTAGALIAVCAATMMITLSPLVFSGVEIVPGLAAPQPVVAPGIVVFIFVAILSLPIGIYFLISRYLAAQSEQKLQLRYLLIGVVSMFLLIISFDFAGPVFFKNTRFIPLSALFTLPFIFFTFYAIAKHGLLNIKVISTEILVFLLALSTLIEVIFSSDIIVLVMRVSVFLLVIALGILLIRSVRREVEQRERLQMLSEQLSTANAELKKLDQAKSEFISLASHQLRAPLTIIKGYISLMLEGTMGQIEETGKKAINIISSSTEQLIKLVNDLLDLSRIEAGKIKYEFKRGDLAAVIKSVTNEFKPRADAKKVEIIMESPAPVQEFLFDPDKMREVLINLIDNAVKYSRDGGEATVKIENAGTVLRVSVRDQGLGIKKEDIEKMFTKFARTEEAQRADPNGLGIGLYFVKRVVEDHGGKVWVESEGIGKGSTFFVELPLKQ